MIDKFTSVGTLNKFSYNNLIWLSRYDSKGIYKNVYKIPSRKGEEYIYLTKSEGSDTVKIKGNLRKWWYGKNNVFNDFSYRSYLNCLKYLAEIIECDLYDLLKFNIRNIEIGMNIKLHRKHARILQSMKSFPKRDRVSYRDETILFSGVKFDIICYDKLKETAEKVIKKRRLIDAMLKENFCLRFELKIMAKSGIRIYKELDSFLSIKDNWNAIIEYVLELFFQIEIIDDFKNVKLVKHEDLNLKELKELFIFYTINEMGIVKSDELIKKFGNRHKSEFKKEFRRIFRKYFTSDNIDVKAIVGNAVIKRAVSLKNT